MGNCMSKKSTTTRVKIVKINYSDDHQKLQYKNYQQEHLNHSSHSNERNSRDETDTTIEKSHDSSNINTQTRYYPFPRTFIRTPSGRRVLSPVNNDFSSIQEESSQQAAAEHDVVSRTNTHIIGDGHGRAGGGVLSIERHPSAHYRGNSVVDVTDNDTVLAITHNALKEQQIKQQNKVHTLSRMLSQHQSTNNYLVRLYSHHKNNQQQSSKRSSGSTQRDHDGDVVDRDSRYGTKSYNDAQHPASRQHSSEENTVQHEHYHGTSPAMHPASSAPGKLRIVKQRCDAAELESEAANALQLPNTIPDDTTTTTTSQQGKPDKQLINSKAYVSSCASVPSTTVHDNTHSLTVSSTNIQCDSVSHLITASVTEVRHTLNTQHTNRDSPITTISSSSSNLNSVYHSQPTLTSFTPRNEPASINSPLNHNHQHADNHISSTSVADTQRSEPNALLTSTTLNESIHTHSTNQVTENQTTDSTESGVNCATVTQHPSTPKPTATFLTPRKPVRKLSIVSSIPRLQFPSELVSPGKQSITLRYSRRVSQLSTKSEREGITSAYSSDTQQSSYRSKNQNRTKARRPSITHHPKHTNRSRNAVPHHPNHTDAPAVMSHRSVSHADTDTHRDESSNVTTAAPSTVAPPIKTNTSLLQRQEHLTPPLFHGTDDSHMVESNQGDISPEGDHHPSAAAPLLDDLVSENDLESPTGAQVEKNDHAVEEMQRLCQSIGQQFLHHNLKYIIPLNHLYHPATAIEDSNTTVVHEHTSTQNNAHRDKVNESVEKKVSICCSLLYACNTVDSQVSALKHAIKLLRSMYDGTIPLYSSIESVGEADGGEGDHTGRSTNGEAKESDSDTSRTYRTQRVLLHPLWDEVAFIVSHITAAVPNKLPHCTEIYVMNVIIALLSAKPLPPLINPTSPSPRNSETTLLTNLSLMNHLLTYTYTRIIHLCGSSNTSGIVDPHHINLCVSYLSIIQTAILNSNDDTYTLHSGYHCNGGGAMSPMDSPESTSSSSEHEHTSDHRSNSCYHFIMSLLNRLCVTEFIGQQIQLLHHSMLARELKTKQEEENDIDGVEIDNNTAVNESSKCDSHSSVDRFAESSENGWEDSMEESDVYIPPPIIQQALAQSSAMQQQKHQQQIQHESQAKEEGTNNVLYDDQNTSITNINEDTQGVLSVTLPRLSIFQHSHQHNSKDNDSKLCTTTHQITTEPYIIVRTPQVHTTMLQVLLSMLSYNIQYPHHSTSSSVHSKDTWHHTNGTCMVLWILHQHLRLQQLQIQYDDEHGSGSVIDCVYNNLLSQPAAQRLMRLLCPYVFHSNTYRVVKQIGRGRFGTVYKGVTSSTSCTTGNNQSVAIKHIDLPKQPHDMKILLDVYNEIQILSSLSSSSWNHTFVHLYDYGVTHDSYWLVTSYSPITLKQLLSCMYNREVETEHHMNDTHPTTTKLHTPQNLLLLLVLYRQILFSMKQLTTLSITHFDMKADNVLIDIDRDVDDDAHDDGNDSNTFNRILSSSSSLAYYLLSHHVSTRICDFGESIQGASSKLSKGTEFIQSPEMLLLQRSMNQSDEHYDRRRLHAADRASDVWSVGCLFIEMLCNQYAYVEEFDAPIFMQVTSDQLPIINPYIQEQIDKWRYPTITAYLHSILVRDRHRRPTIDEAIVLFDKLFLSIFPSVGADSFNHPYPSMDTSLPIVGDWCCTDAADIPLVNSSKEFMTQSMHTFDIDCANTNMNSHVNGTKHADVSRQLFG